MKRARTFALLAVAVLAGCSGIPTSGPVQAAGAGPEPEQNQVVVLADGPQQDAQPVQIVEGFLLAGRAGLSGSLQFEVARQFLAGDSAAWNPLGGVVVSGETTIERTTDTQVTVEVQVAGKLDADGRFSEVPSDARETVTYDMVQDSRGQWRIADPPDGLILSLDAFRDQFRQVQLYFLTPDASALVPEPRWYPAFNLSTSVMRGLLAGPSPWLRDAVRTEIPPGTQLKPESVTVDADGVADVTLEPVGAVQAADRPLLLAQVDATLRQLTQVHSVVVRAGTNGATLEDPAVLRTAGEAEVQVGAEVVHDDTLVSVGGAGLIPVEGVGSLAGLDAHSPARNEDGSLRVLLLGEDTLATAPTADEPPVELLRARGLVAPSVDRFGWVWTASGSQVIAVGSAGTTVTTEPAWLVDRQVRAVRVSRDGTRVAVVSEGADGVSIDIAGVVRDPTGVPQQLTDQAVRAGAAMPVVDQVVWVADNTLAALGRTGGSASVRLLEIGAISQTLPDVAGGLAIAGARPVGSLVVATDDGELLRFEGRSWTPVGGVTGVRDPAYPG